MELLDSLLRRPPSPFCDDDEEFLEKNLDELPVLKELRRPELLLGDSEDGEPDPNIKRMAFLVTDITSTFACRNYML